MIRGESDRDAFLLGMQKDAIYSELDDPMYNYNPYIEALGEKDDDEVITRKLRKVPKYDDSLRYHAASKRVDYVNRLILFKEPTIEHLELASIIWKKLRQGYVKRNPIKAFYIKQMREIFEDADFHLRNGTLQSIPESADGLAVIGPSGVGKTLSMTSVLSLFPQVISHTKYRDNLFIKKQIVWLKINAPPGGTVKGICRRFYEAVDKAIGTNYAKKKDRVPKDRALIEMALTAETLGLGVLVIDEIQRIRADKEGEKTLIEFFTDMIDIMAIPIILVGTHKVGPILNNLPNARRFKPYYWEPLSNEYWDAWIECVWKYQFTNVPKPLTPNLSKVMYEESQGIPDIAIKLYMFLQWELIGSGDEKITVKRIKDVANRHLQGIRPMMDALRTKDPTRLAQYPDLFPAIPSHQLETAFAEANRRAAANAVALSQNNQSEELALDQELTQWLIEEFQVSLDLAPAIAADAIKLLPDKGLKELKLKAAQIVFANLNSSPSPSTKSIQESIQKNKDQDFKGLAVVTQKPPQNRKTYDCESWSKGTEEFL